MIVLSSSRGSLSGLTLIVRHYLLALLCRKSQMVPFSTPSPLPPRSLLRYYMRGSGFSSLSTLSPCSLKPPLILPALFPSLAHRTAVIYPLRLRTNSEPALDCTNSDNGDLAITRSRSGSASALTDSTFTQPSSSFFTSLSSSSLSSSTVQMPQNGGVVIATPRRQSLTSMLMTSLYPAWNKEDTQEVLSSYSSSSVSSPTSSEASPTTPTSASSAFRLPSPLQRAPTHKHLWSNEANLENRDTTKETLPADRKVYTSISSPPPTKRSRSNTVNTCLKSSTALRSITEKGRPEGNIRPTGTTTTARRMTSNLSLRGVPSFSGGGGVKNDGLVSPKSPKSPLAKAFPQTYFEPSSSSSFDGPEDYSLTIKQSSSFGTLLLPSTLSNIPSCNASAVPSTPLTPSHTVYIDHIIVSYSPSSSTGQDCKKLLMRLERFKKRSSLDLSTLSSEQITSSSSPTLSATTTTQRSDAEKIKPEGMKRKVSSSTTTSTSTSKSSPTSASAPSSARISRCNSAGSTPTAHANGTLSPTSPGGTAGSNGNGQILRVIAKIKDHHEQNKIEVSYLQTLRLSNQILQRPNVC